MILTRTAGETKDTIGWEPVPGAVAFKFTVDGKISHTWDPTRTTLAVSKGSERVLVEALAAKDTGVWPNATPPSGEPSGQGAFFVEKFQSQPASFWRYQAGSSAVQWPNAAFTLVDNGTGGKALRIGGSGPGGAGVFGSMWTYNSAWGSKGVELWLRTRVRFDQAFNGFWLEHHENFNSYTNNSIYSCALAFNLDGDRRLQAQTTGGPIEPHLGGKPRGSQTKDTQAIEAGRWYELVEHMLLSERHDTGLHESWVDGRRWFRHQRGTLLTNGTAVDSLAFGLYAYPWQSTPAMSAEFDYLVMGPTQASIG
jgi:hypothetical protein